MSNLTCCTTITILQVLHKERTSRMRGEAANRARLAELPPGVMIVLLENSQQCYLWYDGRLHRWTPAGYPEALSIDPNSMVEVLTPRSVVNAITAGFKPDVEVDAKG